jgi:hypothetical protein
MAKQLERRQSSQESAIKNEALTVFNFLKAHSLKNDRKICLFKQNTTKRR